jgi:glycine/D-amino acid oxidase-like deaminating enzyme
MYVSFNSRPSTSDDPQHKPLSKEDLLPTSISGVSFTTVTIDTPVYLSYLLARLLSRGGSIVRASIQHISQVIEGAFTSARPDAVVVCAGLGARSLGGLEDKDVFPIRGQTVLLRAPWVKFGRTMSDLAEDWTFVIPRRSGDVCSFGHHLCLISMLFVGHSRRD